MNLRNKLKTDQAIGIFSKTIDASFVESAGLSGLDFIILDQEHGTSTHETIQNNVRAALISNLCPIVRVKGVDANAIGSALDSGASGVQIPNVTTAQEAHKAVIAARFYPKGSRGVCRFVRAASFGSQDKESYFKEENKKLVILQVEGIEGVLNLDSILDVPDYDVLFIGTYDLSQSLGKIGQVDAPEVLELLDRVASKAKQKNVILGAFCDTEKNAKMLKGKGFKYLAYSVDVNIFLEACKNIVEVINE